MGNSQTSESANPKKEVSADKGGRGPVSATSTASASNLSKSVPSLDNVWDNTAASTEDSTPKDSNMAINNKLVNNKQATAEGQNKSRDSKPPSLFHEVCADTAKNSLKCLEEVWMRKGEKSECEKFFEAHRNCRKKAQKDMREARRKQLAKADDDDDDN